MSGTANVTRGERKKLSDEWQISLLLFSIFPASCFNFIRPSFSCEVEIAGRGRWSMKQLAKLKNKNFCSWNFLFRCIFVATVAFSTWLKRAQSHLRCIKIVQVDKANDYVCGSFELRYLKPFSMWKTVTLELAKFTRRASNYCNESKLQTFGGLNLWNFVEICADKKYWCERKMFASRNNSFQST